MDAIYNIMVAFYILNFCILILPLSPEVLRVHSFLTFEVNYTLFLCSLSAKV